MIKLTTLTLLILETLCAIQEDLVHLVPVNKVTDTGIWRSLSN